MMTCYIASPYQLRSEANAARLALESAGIGCTARWIWEDDALDHASAQKDLDDIRRADMLIALNPPAWRNAGTGGRWIEFGYAWALGKAVYVVGVRSSLFHYHTTVTVCETLSECINLLRSADAP